MMSKRGNNVMLQKLIMANGKQCALKEAVQLFHLALPGYQVSAHPYFLVKETKEGG